MTGVVRCLCLAVLLGVLVGCQSYRLRGAVVHGQKPGVYVVAPDDDRLNRGGIEDASLEFTLDPQSMRPKQIGVVQSDVYGRFDTPVEAMGAGFLEYELGVLSRGKGLRSVWQILPMPPAGKRLLIVMEPGKDTYQRPTDFTEETLEMGRQLQSQ